MIDESMDDSEVTYIIYYYRHLMSPQEKAAHEHLIAAFRKEREETRCVRLRKAMLQHTGRQRKEMEQELHFMESYKASLPSPVTTDPEVLRLTEQGLDNFVRHTAQRIFRDFAPTVDFHRCPQCGRLPRTPQARQCRFCRHDWHSSAG